MRRSGRARQHAAGTGAVGSLLLCDTPPANRSASALLDAVAPDDHISTLHWAFDEYAAKDEFRLRTIRYYTALLNAKAGRTNEAMTELQALNKEMAQDGAQRLAAPGRPGDPQATPVALTFRYTLGELSQEGDMRAELMRASYASGIAIALGALFVVPHAVRAPQLRAPLRLQQAGEHLRHDHRVRGAQSTQLPSHLRDRRERPHARVRLRIARRHAVVAQRDQTRDAQGGHEGPRDRIAVASQRLHVLLRQRRVRGRPHAERQRAEGRCSRGACRRTGAPGAQGHLRHLAACADSEPEHEWSAADDPVPDAGRREGGRRLRSVQRRSDVPLRSRRDPPRLGRTWHSARGRAQTATTSCSITSGWTCVASST